MCSKAISLSFGVEKEFIHDIKNEVQNKSSISADFLAIPLFHPRLRRDDIGVSRSRSGPSTWSDRELESQEWKTVYGCISKWIDLDCHDIVLQNSSCMTLEQEIAWAAHLSLQAIIIPTPNLTSPNYVKALLQNLTGFQQVMVRIPLVLPLSIYFENTAGYCKDGWIVWDNFRQLFGDFNCLFVALELTNDISEDIDDNYVKRWAAEPLKVMIISTGLFLTNQSGYPVLPKHIQRVVGMLLPYVGQIMFTGRPLHKYSPSAGCDKTTSDCNVIDDNDSSYLPYIQYMRHLKAKSQANLSDGERFVLGYEDVLQAPLQPLMDNLESQTYETFERDPIKYIKYEEAIVKALRCLHRKRITACASNKHSDFDRNKTTYNNHSNAIEVNEEVTALSTSPALSIVLVVTVVGAGRGPLVAAVLSASCHTNIPVRVYAVEKNRYAVVTLRNRVLSERWDNVKIISQDMREWIPEEACDLMVSELLGSFGDNELSPECLDGAQKCLKSDGISIPCDYTSFVSPIASSKLWTAARSLSSSGGGGGSGFRGCNAIQTIANGLETPYVVRLRSYYQFAEAKPLFRFQHPQHRQAAATEIDNTR